MLLLCAFLLMLQICNCMSEASTLDHRSRNKTTFNTSSDVHNYHEHRLLLGGSWSFSYTGAVQTFTVPAGFTNVRITVTGASGGTITYDNVQWIGGPRFKFTATVPVTAGQVLQVNVGSYGTTTAGGYNGGGAPGNSGYSGNTGGGGATDIRVSPYALSNRILVAGGGGGVYGGKSTCSKCGGPGGYSGFPSGLSGSTKSSYAAGSGGSQSAGGIQSSCGSTCSGALGRGGAGAVGYYGAGGGGGYYGGGGGKESGAGGGSSYSLYTVESQSIAGSTTSANQENGMAYIEYSGPPTAAPSLLPVLSPTAKPIIAPTPAPISMPTLAPISAPTYLPTVNPSIAPTAVPTPSPTAPTCAPTTLQPSINPTMSPTEDPTIAPTCAPTSNPTPTVSNSPTFGPTAKPTCYPTEEPTVRPSADPTERPTASPTVAPTVSTCPPGTHYESPSSPEVCLSCPVGQYSDVYGGAASCTQCATGHYTPTSGASACAPCPTGTYWSYATANATACNSCAAGSYQDSTAASSCLACKVNTYAAGSGSALCNACPAGQVSPASSVSSAACVNPGINFATGGFCLMLAVLISVVYIFYGRMNAVAFGRKCHIQAAGKTYKTLIQTIQHIELEAPEDEASGLWKSVLFWTFIAVSVVLVTAATVMLSLFSFAHIFFMTMVIARNISSLQLSFTVPFTVRVEAFTAVLETIASPLATLLKYVLYMYVVLASLHINLSAVQVTCLGSQAPITLLIDVLAFIVVVVLIECDVAAFLATTFYEAHREFRTVILNPKAKKTIDFPTYLKIWHWGLSMVESNLFQATLIVSALQYLMGFMYISEFFATGGVHRSSANCDNQHGVPYIDTALALGSSLLAYLLVPAVIYTISKLLVPRLLLKDKLRADRAQGAVHTHLIYPIQQQPLTLPYSPIPSPDYFLSWRFLWAYNILNLPTYTNRNELMFRAKSDTVVEKPSGLGLCPLVSTSNAAFQEKWRAECEERLPSYGSVCSVALIIYSRTVVENFFTFLSVMLGVWDADAVRRFDVVESLHMSGFDVPDEVLSPEFEETNRTPWHASLRKLLGKMVCYRSPADATAGQDSVPEDGGLSRNQVSSLLSAELSMRSTLFMLFPGGALVTMYVSSTSAYPIFCRRAKVLNKLLPSLLVFDAFALAERRVLAMGSYARWKVRVMTLYIFFNESRLLNYIYHLMRFLLAISLNLHSATDGGQYVLLIVGCVVIILHNFVISLYITILVGNMLGINDEEMGTMPVPAYMGGVEMGNMAVEDKEIGDSGEYVGAESGDESGYHQVKQDEVGGDLNAAVQCVGAGTEEVKLPYYGMSGPAAADEDEVVLEYVYPEESNEIYYDAIERVSDLNNTYI